MRTLDQRFAAKQIEGARDYQEDDYGLVDGRDIGADGEEHTVLVLADGMGGHAGGNTASQTVVRQFIECYQREEGPVTDRLRAALAHANEALEAQIEANPTLDGMGTTLLAAAITTRGLEWISVGDSPLWLCHGGQLRRLNADHSMAPVLDDLVEMGRMSPAEAEADPSRHSLRSAVCGDEILYVDVSSQPVPLAADDWVIAASDGLETLDEGEIAAVIGSNAALPPARLAALLLEKVEAAKRPNQDNTTVMLYCPQQAYGRLQQTAPAENGRGTPARPGARRFLWPVTLAALLVAVLVLAYFWVTAPLAPVAPQFERGDGGPAMSRPAQVPLAPSSGARENDALERGSPARMQVEATPPGPASPTGPASPGGAVSTPPPPIVTDARSDHVGAPASEYGPDKPHEVLAAPAERDAASAPEGTSLASEAPVELERAPASMSGPAR